MYLYNWRPITRLLNPGGVLKEFLGGDLPLANTRASSTEFCYPILDLTPQIPPILNLNLPICFFYIFERQFLVSLFALIASLLLDTINSWVFLLDKDIT